jgi:hypothetical protein
MAEDYKSDYLADIKVGFEVPDYNMDQFSIREVTMMESLMTPGLQTSISVDSYLHNPVKNWDDFKNARVVVKIERPILARYGFPSEMIFNNTVYRIQNRKLINNNNENLTIQALHETQLEDARKLISKPWKCKTPSTVVKEVLGACIGAQSINVEDSGPARDYTAENIHPYQVIAQQAEVALTGAADPSFVHFMTYENNGTHNFRSLEAMTKQSPVAKFRFTETGYNPESGEDRGYQNPLSILTHSFPCDFDLLSDLLNGTNTDGSFIGSLIVENLKNTISSSLNFTPGACATGATLKTAQTNINTSEDQLSCAIDVENHLLKRQARMGLLEQDKIALRLTVPWNPALNAGKVIEIERLSNDLKGVKLYGSGSYLIHTLTHIVKAGGYATTVMDCVSTTVGGGVA